MPKRRTLADRVTDSFRVLTELDLSHAYERQAGTVALALLGVVAVVVLIVTGLPGQARDSLQVTVELPAAPGLSRGDPVLVRGARVGRVERVQLRSPGHVEVTLSVDREHAPRRDADAQLLALDLIGNQAVQYDPGRAAEALPPAEPVVGSPSVLFNDRLTQLKEQGAELLVGLRDVDPEALKAEVARTRQALARLRTAAATFPADSLARAAGATVARGDSLLAAYGALKAAFPRAAIRTQRESLTVNLGTVFQEVGEVQESLDRLRERMAGTEGNVGRFRNDTTFRHELDAARTSLRRLLEKFGVRPPAAPPP